jgi:hypothetical protein
MKIVLISATLIIVTIGLWTTYRKQKMGDAFERAAVGETEPDLIRQLGAPWKTAACGDTFGGDVPQGCAKEILYASPFAPVLPEYWAFRYNRDGQLLDKYHYVSP